MADYYQPQRAYPGPLDNNGYAMTSSLDSADFRGAQQQNKLIDIIDTYQMQPKQGQGMGPSKSTAGLNDYYFNPGNPQNGNNSGMQDYPAYASPSRTNLKAPAYDSQGNYPGSMSYRDSREILSKKVIHPDDLRNHEGYVPVGSSMRNPMYANHNYLKHQQQQQSSPFKAPRFQDSIDALSYNMGDRTQNREAPSYNSLSYRTDEAAGNYKQSPNVNNKAQNNNAGPKETLKYYNDEMFASPTARSKAADEGYASPTMRNKAYLSNLNSSSADKSPLEYGNKLSSPIQRKQHDVYVFNPLTQTPVLRFQSQHLLKNKDTR